MLKTKLVAAGLTAALAVCALGGCAGPSEQSQSEDAKAPETTQAAESEKPAEATSDDDASKETPEAPEQEKAEAETGTEVTPESEEATEAPEDNSAPVDTSGLVEITLPAGFAGELTQEQLDEGVSDGEYQAATLNEDGSVTLYVTPEQRDEYEATLRASIQEGLDELSGPEGIPDVVSIEANDNYTSFIVTTSAEEVGTEEAFSILAFALYGGVYNSVLGTEIDNVHVEFVNADTGEVLESVDTKDMGEQ